MYLSQFLFKPVQIRGAMGVFTEIRVSPMGTCGLSLHGKNIPSDKNGWVEVGFDDGLELKKMVHHRPDHATVRWLSPDEVDEHLRLGLTEQGSVAGPIGTPRGLESGSRAEPLVSGSQPGLESGSSQEPVRRGPGRPRKDGTPELADDGGRPSSDEELAAAAAASGD